MPAADATMLDGNMDDKPKSNPKGFKVLTARDLNYKTDFAVTQLTAKFAAYTATANKYF